MGTRAAKRAEARLVLAEIEDDARPAAGDGWREQFCQEADCVHAGRPQHIHCFWGGWHIHVVNDEGETVETIPRGA